MVTYPTIDPIAFQIGPLAVHWYGLMYLFAFAFGWGLGVFRAHRYQLNWTREAIGDLIFYAAIGVILGGRLGYMLFYNTEALLHTPWVILELWKGGMSFHGGILGVAIALYFFKRKTKKSYLEIADFIAPLAPLGLGLGRIGNFINGELWGRVTDLPWAMVFPMAGSQPRHPSQLYEAGLEGIGLFILVFWYSSKKRPTGRVSALFLIGYGLCRFVVEFFREPDVQRGFIAFNWLTMGQLLSLPMILIGLYLWWAKRCNPIYS